MDPFSGTFTTSAVAQKLNRISIGIERDVDYVKIGLRRLNISTHFMGEELKPIDKKYRRKNANGKKGAVNQNSDKQTKLFGE